MYVLWWITVDANLVLSPPFCRNKKSSVAECDFENFKALPCFILPLDGVIKEIMHESTKQTVSIWNAYEMLPLDVYSSLLEYQRILWRVWYAANEVLVMNDFNEEVECLWSILPNNSFNMFWLLKVKVSVWSVFVPKEIIIKV